MASVITKVVLGIVASFLVILFFIYVTGGLSMLTADFRGEVDKREKVEADGDYRIAQYDRFHNLCQDIQAKNEEIKDAKAMLSGDQEKQNVYAHTQAKNEMVGDYNAMANQDYTAGQFRDSNLPYHIDPNDEEIECEG